MSVGSSFLSSKPWRYQRTNFSLALRSVSPRLRTITVYPQWMQAQLCCNSRWWHRYACLLCALKQIFFCTRLLSRTNFVSPSLSDLVFSARSFPVCCSRPLRVFVNRALRSEQALMQNLRLNLLHLLFDLHLSQHTAVPVVLPLGLIACAYGDSQSPRSCNRQCRLEEATNDICQINLRTLHTLVVILSTKRHASKL
jgi:hypothetical protein